MTPHPPDFQLLKIDLAGLACVASAALIAWLTLVSPALERKHAENHAALQLPEARKLSADEARQLAHSEAELRRVKRELESYQHPSWTNPDRNHRIESLISIGRAHHLDVESVEPGEAETIASRRAMPLRLFARGRTTALNATLSALRTQMPDLILRSLDLTPVDDPVKPHLLISAEFLWIPPVIPTASHTTSSHSRLPAQP